MGQLHNVGEVDGCPDLTLHTVNASKGGQYLVSLHTASPKNISVRKERYRAATAKRVAPSGTPDLY